MLQPCSRIRLSPLPLTTWKLKALSATALSQSVSRATKNTILMLLLSSLEQVFDLTFGYMVETCTFTYCLHLWQIFPVNFFPVEIWKHDTDFSINFHCFSISYFVNIIYYFWYYFKGTPNADSKYSDLFCFTLKNMPKVSHHSKV